MNETGRRLWTSFFLIQTTVCILFITILVISIRVNTQKLQVESALRAAKVPTVAPASEVDYQRIEAMIMEKVAALPKPQNGVDGEDGTTTIVERKVVETIALPQIPGPIGPIGPMGRDAIIPEQRANPTTHETEWRCPGDTLWTTLISSPILRSSCE